MNNATETQSGIIVQQEQVFKWMQLSSKVKNIILFYILNSSVNASFFKCASRNHCNIIPAFYIPDFNIQNVNGQQIMHFYSRPNKY